MKPNRFSSLSAFLEYYAVLRRVSSLSDEERTTLAAMEQVLGTLTPEERASLNDPASGAAARRCERARRKLARSLAASNLLEA